HKLQGRFGLTNVTLVCDRGLLTQARIDALHEFPGIGFLSALRSTSIRKLVEGGDIQMTLFDKQNLCEITSEEYPGERLVACYNPLLAAERARKRLALLAATEEQLSVIEKGVARRKEKLLSKEDIALRVGRIIDRYKMRKHFDLVFGDGFFSYTRDTASIEREAALDGIYVLRTDVEKDVLSAEDTVVTYKSLSQVERAFRTMKGMDLRVRPIRHYTEDHVRAHLFLCMLAYYVEWHLRRAVGELLFDDTYLDTERWMRDPVAPAKGSRSSLEKKKSRETVGGFAVHSFETMMVELATRCRHTCSTPGSQGLTFTMEIEPTPWQSKVMDLLKVYAP
ncbi:MAG: transposase, partial [Fibrobacterota bacterium]|nr:transposase [Fibrobacterota bacterium]